jgi:hypothetical protein
MRMLCTTGLAAPRYHHQLLTPPALRPLALALAMDLMSIALPAHAETTAAEGKRSA